MTKPLISVVVPLYRVEAEMPLCVDSVLAQTYDRLDVILVDDGSPDGCGRLAEDYARRDARVRAIRAVRTAKTSIEFGVVAGRRGEA